MFTLSLGCNVAGTWGDPIDTLREAVRILSGPNPRDTIVAPLYRTRPVGHVRQPMFLNTTLQCGNGLLVSSALSWIKSMERAAGRRPGVRDGPRPLDIDIVDLDGWIVGWVPQSPRRPRFVLPHPKMHERGFVLRPLCDIDPYWRHPVWGWRVSDWLKRHPELTHGTERWVDSGWHLCDMRR